MLLLSRRVGEEIIIGDDIRVKIIDVKGNQVKLGISAPKDTTVHRIEIYDRIQTKKKNNTLI